MANYKGKRPQGKTKGQNGSFDDKKEAKMSRGNNKKRSNPRKDNNDSRGYEEKKSDSGALTVSGYSNDPRWYKRVGVLALDSSNFSTYTPNGLPYYIGLKGDQHEFTPSGIMRLDYAPNFGDVSGVASPLAIAARDLYDYVNSRNSRSSSYDPSDLMLYCIGVANAWVLHAAIRRIVGMFNTYSVMNRYWWDPVLESMNIVPIKSTNDITNWVNFANRMALTLNSLAVPEDITYFKRAQFMCESIFADSLSSKASLYYYLPKYLLKYQYDAEGKGELVSVATPWSNVHNDSRNLTVDRFETFFNSLVENLINDTDIAYMKADIRKAFGEEHCYTLPQIDVTFRHPFVYDEFVNLQTRNATVHDELGNYFYSLSQDMTTNTLRSNRVVDYLNDHHSDLDGVFGALYLTRGGDQVFDFPVDNVDNDLWIEATKVHPYYQIDTFKCTSEVVVGVYAYTFAMMNGIWTLTKNTKVTNIYVIAQSPVSIGYLDIALKGMEDSSKFAASPLLWVDISDGLNAWSGNHKVYLIDDLTNFTMIAPKDLTNQIDSSQLSLFSWRDLA